jgi:hypothetical protein
LALAEMVALQIQMEIPDQIRFLALLHQVVVVMALTPLMVAAVGLVVGLVVQRLQIMMEEQEPQIKDMPVVTHLTILEIRLVPVVVVLAQWVLRQQVVQQAVLEEMAFLQV